MLMHSSTMKENTFGGLAQPGAPVSFAGISPTGHGNRAARLVLALAAVLTMPACAARQPPLPPAPAARLIDVTAPDDLPALAAAVAPLADQRTFAELATAPALAVAAGEATYYASLFDGRRTASGIVFSNEEPFAAHRTWPFGTVVRVTNERNGREVLLTVVDRGPNGTSERALRTVIDVSQSAARELDFILDGRVPVRVEVLRWGEG